MLITIIASLFGVLTLVGIGFWIWAYTHEGPTGLAAFWTIVAVGCLIVSVAYGVHARHNQPTEQTRITKSQKDLKSSSYFAETAKQKQAKELQQRREKAILKELRTTYKKNLGDVTFDASKKQYVIQVTKTGYHKALVIVRKHPKQNKKALRTIRKSFVDASKAVTKTAKKSGYSLLLRDGSRSILEVKDGRIVADRLVE